MIVLKRCYVNSLFVCESNSLGMRNLWEIFLKFCGKAPAVSMKVGKLYSIWRPLNSVDGLCTPELFSHLDKFEKK